ncbi:tRNA (adenosine(37)-N6)-threonylcarbamoyltransferase complex dimerization subunit type 1 TsaB [Paenibacillus sp. LHD-117]|uniref:tRNA (adenosine(37)-N6)-threonylcarbamoyltransferase complex dimerization subunit type 1 TsaB n=1 Tax=Paenibacillus sp. LHD-117 TaxID=3071412 RepID=UPI0027E0DDD8|nr:tRNA (adenosine(37)-N6)-threonylcarbamoyltransferase complex dimerization subunit type 1 TsaB [Paenibacillus sp. LHD-117]MDQ6420091.1 tRNA (adenosine(37)-N6)-threonylcarbamoyltransferase complex dimerization subunit type 1 TsaB [Paenibacillus sp. LHD-117]
MNTATWGESGPVIALDTSTAAMAAAVLRGGVTLSEVQSLAERNHSVHVISHVKAMMSEAGVAPDELAAIIVGNGPGSYTGMRIAVTAAKTLAWCWRKPLVGVSSLEAIGFGAWHRGAERVLMAGEEAFARQEWGREREHWVLPIMDARRGQVYSAGFVCRADGAALEDWTRFAEDGVRLMDQWVESIAERIGAEAGRLGGAAPVIWLVGDLSLHEQSAERLAALGGSLGADVRLMPYVMEGRFLAELGLKRLSAGESDDVHTFIPNYTQLTEAEVKLKAKQAGET